MFWIQIEPSEDRRVSHHEGGEGHEGRIAERPSNLKRIFFPFVLFERFVVRFSYFWWRLSRAGSFVVMR
jgi:hypothetical protein